MYRLTIAWLLMLPNLLQAQNRDYHIERYTTDEGLPQNSITGIIFDRAGYCWLGTEMGLVRFDGKKFTVFNSTNLPGLFSPRISLCSSDDEGNVFMKTEKGELIRINTDIKQIAPYPEAQSGDSLWFWNSIVPGFVANRRGPVPAISYTRTHNKYSYLLSSGDIYCFDQDTLYYMQEGRLIPVDNDLQAPLKFLAVGDNFLVSERKSTFRRWKNGQREKDISFMSGPLHQNKAFRNGDFQCFYNSGQNYVYAGGSLYSVYEENGQLETKSLLEGLDIPVLYSVYYNATENKYYLGSLVSGLYVITPSAFHFLGDKPDIINKSIFAQAINSRGDIICQRFLYERSGRTRELPLNTWVGSSLWLDKDRYLYYGDGPELYRYDFVTNSNRKVYELDSRPSSIFRDRFDTSSIVIGTSRGIGRLSGETLQAIKQVPGKLNIIAIAQTGKDSFILATESGVKWYDHGANKVYRSALDSVYVRNVYAEPGGRVWIGTYGGGTYLFDKKKIYSFPSTINNALLTVHCFIEDGRGNFWLPTNNGLFVVKKASLLAYAEGTGTDIYFYMYSVSDNLLTNEFNGGCTPAYIWTKDSLLSIPSIAGLVQFDPRKLQPVLPGKKIYAEGFRLNDSLIRPDGNTLSLSPDYGRLTINISCPYFGNPKNLGLVYMVKGLDENWQPVPDNNEIVLNRLPAGNYRLMVRKLSDDGVNDNDAFIFSFSVSPWFYNTWWFYCLLFILACMVTFITVKTRTRILLSRNNKLQAIIRAQTADLSKTVEQLKASEHALQESNLMKDRVTTMVLHDLRSPIRFLYTISNQLLKKHQHLSSTEIEKNLSILQSSTRSLNDFTEQFLTWAASQHHDFKIHPETFSLQSFFDELEELYADIARANNNVLVAERTSLDVHTDRNILSAIIRNLLDNASKNTMNGWLRLSANRRDDKLVVTVADTGPGISEEAIAVFYEAGRQTDHTHNGSSIVLNLLEKIGGDLKIVSAIGKGATFIVELNHHQSNHSGGPGDQVPGEKPLPVS